MTSQPHDQKQTHSIQLGMAGRRLSFRTNSSRVAELAGDFFPYRGLGADREPEATITMIVREQSGRARANGNFPVFRGRKQFVHADFGCDGSVWFDLQACTVLGVVTKTLIEDAGFFQRAVLAVIAGVLAPSLSLLAVHAACVVRNGKGVLLAAQSGVGKSTLALTLALRGWSLLSDDWTFVGPQPGGLLAWGMQTSVKLLPDAVDFFPFLAASSPAASLNGELAFEVDPWEFFRIGRAVHAQPTLLVFLERNHYPSTTAGQSMRQCRPDEARAYLYRDIEEQPREIRGESECQQLLIEQLCKLPAFTLRIGDHPTAVAAQVDQFLAERACA